MLCGVASLLLCWLSYLDFFLITPAMALSFAVLVDERSSSRRQAWAGMICAVIGLIGAFVFTIVYLNVIVHLVHECHPSSGADFRQCLSQHL